MSAIEIIKDKWKKYPQLNYKVEGNKISIEPSSATGFTAWLIENNPGFDGWHEEFERQEEALDSFAFGLSEECRLKVIKRGNMRCSWTLQNRNGNDWYDDSTTGMIFIPFWRNKIIEYLSNPIIRASEQPCVGDGEEHTAPNT